LAAAKDCVAATQAPDAKAAAAAATKIMDCATGDFATQAKIYGGVLVDAYQAANAQVQVSDLRAAVERQNPDGTVDVLVAVRTKLSNAGQEAEEQGYRLRVRMADDGGTYKVSRMDQVSQ
jgi:Mce-associated membrane protein